MWRQSAGSPSAAARHTRHTHAAAGGAGRARCERIIAVVWAVGRGAADWEHCCKRQGRPSHIELLCDE